MATERPLVAVTPLMDYGRDSLWMLPGYMEAVMRAGGTPVMLPLTGDADILAQCAERFDAFLFTGGPDVGPSVGAKCQGAAAAKSHDSGEATAQGADADELECMARKIDKITAQSATNDCNQDTVDCGTADKARTDAFVTGRSEVLSPERDRMESLLLPAVMALDKPILGICRGIQFINAALGGTLWQDLPSEHPSDIEHHMDPPYDAFGHTVTLVPSTPLAALFAGQSEIAVNSYHHQAVREPAAGLEVMATAPDGVIEALYRPSSRFLWAVQWHPEFLYKVDARSQAIFDAFVSSCRR